MLLCMWSEVLRNEDIIEVYEAISPPSSAPTNIPNPLTLNDRR